MTSSMIIMLFVGFFDLIVSSNFHALVGVNDKIVLFGEIESRQGEYLVSLTMKHENAASPYQFLYSHSESKKLYGGQFSFLLQNTDHYHDGKISLNIINLKCKNFIYKKTIPHGMVIISLLNII